MTIKSGLSLAALAVLSLAHSASAAQGGLPFDIPLTGAAEVPGPGDPDGTGSAELRVNPGQREICYVLRVSNIEPATMAHIHRGTEDVAGPIVVHLLAPSGGTSRACAPVDRALAQEIIQDPSNFYVNVHNAPFPRGAVRGQLER